MRRLTGPLALGALAALLAVPSTAPARSAGPRALEVQVRDDRILVTYVTHRDRVPSETAPVARLIPAPAGVENGIAHVISCAVDGREIPLDGLPPDLVTAGRVMSMRDTRWVPLVLRPDRIPDTGELRHSRRIEVVLALEGAAKALSTPSPETHAAEAEPGEALFSAVHSDDPTGYLVVTVPEYEADLASLIDWKRRKGYEVRVATTVETGGTVEEIGDYIRNAYETWDAPPLYVLLVGDVGDIPADLVQSNVADHPFTLLEGEDFLPDLFIGRFPAGDNLDVQTMVMKTVRYERHPHTDGGGTWFTRALMTAADYGAPTPVEASRYCAQQLLNLGFAAVESVYCASGCPGQEPITAAVDSGVTIVSYRGWARGPEGWHAPDFRVTYVPALSNGWKLPVVLSWVCHTGNFGYEEESFAEAWVRAGSAAEPRGAVAFIGTADPWSHTRWNDRMATGFSDAMRLSGLSRLGPLLASTKIRLIDEFPSELWMSEAGEESVEFYFHIYNLLGDPELSVWTAEPRAITVAHPDTVMVGSNFIEVRVAETKAGAPVADARVGIVQGERLLGFAHTGENGLALVPAVPDTTADSLNITVTGANLAPYEGVATVAVAEPFPAYAGHEIDDDTAGESSGNGDGELNPGETVEIGLTLGNPGAAQATGVTARVDSVWGAEVLDGETAFADIAAGGEAVSESPLVFRIAPTAEDGQVVRVGLEVAYDASEHSASAFTLQVAAPDPLYVSSLVSPDSVLDPGDDAELTVRLVNAGSAAGSGLAGVLRSFHSLVAVTDSTGEFGDFAVGDTVENSTDPFAVSVEEVTAVGQSAALELILTTAEGATLRTSFALVIGRVDHSAPLGPDGHGYYAYDNSDKEYGERPLYDWIPCSPAYGGEGVNLELRDNQLVALALPFDFTFYGVSYDSVAVSDNGWISFDTSWCLDFFNWHLPNAYGNFAQVAAFWENLNPRRWDEEHVRVGDGVYAWSDSAEHRFVVEWSRIPYFDQIEDDNLQTFEIILYDPEFYTTCTGDGEIVFQYKQIVDADDQHQGATVGIENDTETVGLEYAFSRIYPPGAAPLSAGLAIKFTTDEPMRLIQAGALEMAFDGRPRLSSCPNPFNPSTMIRYSLVEDGRVSINVYDVLGREVASLVTGPHSAGTHEVLWDAADCGSGVYFCRLVVGGESETIKLMLLK